MDSHHAGSDMRTIGVPGIQRVTDTQGATEIQGVTETLEVTDITGVTGMAGVTDTDMYDCFELMTSQDVRALDEALRGKR
jgi:hypothetical protein